MMNFTTDQWVIVALIFVLGLLIGGFLFSGGGRKWKHRYNAEVARREDVERSYAAREKEWREADSLRGAALKDRQRDTVLADRDTVLTRDRDNDGVRDDRDPVVSRDRDGDGVRDDRDPVDNRKL